MNQQRRFGRPRPAYGSAQRSFGHRSFNNNRPRQKVTSVPVSEIEAFIARSRPVKTATEPVAPYEPTHRFADWPLAESLQRAIAAKGYTQPTPIQDQAITPILEGRDLIGLAQTGTGKTGAFLIPLLQRMLDNQLQNVLIIAPTRELAVQIRDEFSALTVNTPITSALCIGGANITSQIHSLFKNPRVVIGTPGRLRDLIDRGKLHLSETNAVVLDEVDRMLDMGFIKDIRAILELLHADRQSLFFSATLPPATKELTASFVHNPVTVAMKANNPTDQVEQRLIKVADNNAKYAELKNLLTDPALSKVLVFGRTKFGVEKIAKRLYQDGIPADSIHGGKFQSKRQRALDAFKAGKTRVLVATDVAARGLDISSVTHVINYDLPTNLEDYIHRIGRTGRANQTGVAISLVETNAHSEGKPGPRPFNNHRHFQPRRFQRR